MHELIALFAQRDTNKMSQLFPTVFFLPYPFSAHKHTSTIHFLAVSVSKFWFKIEVRCDWVRNQKHV